MQAIVRAQATVRSHQARHSLDKENRYPLENRPRRSMVRIFLKHIPLAISFNYLSHRVLSQFYRKKFVMQEVHSTARGSLLLQRLRAIWMRAPKLLRLTHSRLVQDSAQSIARCWNASTMDQTMPFRCSIAKTHRTSSGASLATSVKLQHLLKVLVEIASTSLAPSSRATWQTLSRSRPSRGHSAPPSKDPRRGQRRGSRSARS